MGRVMEKAWDQKRRRQVAERKEKLEEEKRYS